MIKDKRDMLSILSLYSYICICDNTYTYTTNNMIIVEISHDKYSINQKAKKDKLEQRTEKQLARG